ncbi:hypothetical protein [Bdellovibrio sp. BCCA]|uniref:hypothetical protein n=1 Tax=Bdellovibrio sp. BCCA TaxID=3136281 RepID=UPI0030F0091D
MAFLFPVLLVVQFLCSIWFYYKQNKGAFVGGPISWPKAVWLYHAIFSWFLVPLVYLSLPDLHISLKILIGLHALIWWIRGPLELVMIYKFFNWTPRYGITHDVFHVILLFAGMVATAKLWPENMTNWMAFIYCAVTVLMLCFEISFAALFLDVRGNEDCRIYYAADEPKWKFINWLTKVGLAFGVGHAIIQAILAIAYL